MQHKVKNVLYKSPLGGPCKHFGRPELGCYGTACTYNHFVYAGIYISIYILKNSFNT